MMDVRDISEFDLMGVLFIHYPNELSFAECRERLELEILFAAQEDGAEDFEICISPYWVIRALFKRSQDEFRALPREQRRAAVVAARKAFLESRKSRRQSAEIRQVK